MQPVTQYAKSDSVHIAYQVYGEGRINLLVVPGFISNVENSWEQPELARWMLRIASYARVVMFDKRGTGMSDRVTDLPGLDQRMDDLRAVMDAAGLQRAAVMGISEGGPLAALSPQLTRQVPGVGPLWQLRACSAGGDRSVSQLCR